MGHEGFSLAGKRESEEVHYQLLAKTMGEERKVVGVAFHRLLPLAEEEGQTERRVLGRVRACVSVDATCHSVEMDLLLTEGCPSAP